MNNLNSLLNQQQMSSLQLQEIPDHPQFDPTSSHDEFLHQMLSLTSPASAFPWADDQTTSSHHQISSGAARAMMLQQQLLLSRSLSAANDLRSPTDADAGFFAAPPDDRDNVVDGTSFKPSIPENDASIKALFNGFSESLGQRTNQAQHFHHSQTDSFGVSAAAPASAATQPSTAAQPRQRVRARRGQATDPHSIAERLRRERIAERMKALQELVPNANRTDKASMLDEIIDYVKFLQLQVKVLSTSRLGGVAAGPSSLHGDASSQGKNSNGAESTAASSENEGMKTAEQKVAKLLEEDMGSAMQYLQGKGLCLMPISLATTISSTTQTST